MLRGPGPWFRGDLAVPSERTSITAPQGRLKWYSVKAIHSEVGDTCTGAKINGRIAPLSRERG